MKLLSKIKNLVSGKKPSYYSREYYYEQLLETKIRPSFFIKFLSKFNLDNDIRQTSKELLLGQDIPFGTEKSVVYETLGEPCFSGSNKHSFKHEISIFKQNIGGLKSKIEVHFINNRLFSYHYKFSYLSHEQKELLLNTLSFKYFNKSKNAIHAGETVFDRNGNMLFVDNSVNLRLHYVSSNASAHNAIEMALDFKHAHVEQRKRKRELELLYML